MTILIKQTKKKKKLKMAANANIDQKKEDWTRA